MSESTDAPPNAPKNGAPDANDSLKRTHVAGTVESAAGESAEDAGRRQFRGEGWQEGEQSSEEREQLPCHASRRVFLKRRMNSQAITHHTVTVGGDTIFNMFEYSCIMPLLQRFWAAMKSSWASAYDPENA
jgi:hypothetical protein